MEIRDYLRILWRQWPWAVLIFVVSFGMLFYMMQQKAPKQYTSEMEVVIREESYTYPTEHLPFQGVFKQLVTPETRLTLIRTRDLLVPVIDKLREKGYGIYAKVPAEPQRDSFETEEKFKAAKQARDKALNPLVRQLRAAIRRNQDEASPIAYISTTGGNEELTKDIVMLVANQLNESSTREQKDRMEAVRVRWEEYRDKLEEEITELTALENKYKNELKDVVLSTKIEAKKGSIAEANKEIEQISRKLEEQTFEIQFLKESLEAGSIPVKADHVSNKVRDLQDARDKLQSQLDKLLIERTENHPSVIALKKELRIKDAEIITASRRTELTAKLDSIFDAKDRLGVLQAEIAENTNRLVSRRAAIKIKDKEYRELVQQQNNLDDDKKLALEQLPRVSTRLSQAIDSQNRYVAALDGLALQKDLVQGQEPFYIASQVPNITEIDPSKEAPLPLILLVSVMLGLGTAYFFEYINTTIRTEYDIKRYVNLPLLGAINHVKNEPERLLLNVAQKVPFHEVFNTIGTLMESYSTETGAKSFIFASSRPEEGKSTVTANTAIALARSGRKVVLIDCDLRKSVQHRFFGVENSRGLTTLWELRRNEDPENPSPAANIDNYLFETEVENLTLLPTGSHPKNPVALLKSAEFKQIIEECKERCDVLLIDVPPINLAVDTMVIGSLIDAILLLVSAGETHKDEVSNAKRLLDTSKGNLIGAVLNKVTIHSKGYYYYYYYYDGYKYYRES